MNDFYEEDENVEDIKMILEDAPSGVTSEPSSFENSVNNVIRTAEVNDLDYVVVWSKQDGNGTLRFVESYKRYTQFRECSKFWKNFGFSNARTVYTGPL